MITKHGLNIGKLSAKIAIAASITFALGRKLLKAVRPSRRSTKPADGLTMLAFNLSVRKRISFREARQELRNSALSRLREARAQAKRDRLSPLKAALNSLKTMLSLRANA